MKKSFKKYEKAGLPGGPNELKRFTQGFIVSERGQWDYPGLPTAVPTPTGKITMKGVEDDLLGIDNLGNAQYMTPGNEYQFEGDMVYEIPQAKKGGSKKYPKKYSRNLMARNILFTKNPLFKKSKSVKNKIFDPNSPYFASGGEIISFDFDDTLSTDRGLQMAQSIPNEKYIISARAEVTPDMIERARAAGISEDRIFATGSDKAKIAKIKELGINRHIDNKQSVINKLGSAGQIFQAGGENGPGNEVEKQRQWLISYLRSPMYKERLKKEFPGKDDNFINNEANIRLNNLLSTKINYVPSIGVEPGWISGLYVPKQYKGQVLENKKWVSTKWEKDPIHGYDKKGNIYLESEYNPNSWYPNSGFETTPLHEMGHAIDDGGFRIPVQTEKKIFMYTGAPDEYSRYQYLNNGKPFYYTNKPSEFINRIQPIRYLLNEQNIYDTRKKEFTESDYNKMMKNPKIIEDVNFQDVMNTLKGDKKKAFIDIMNTIALQENGELLEASYGYSVGNLIRKQGGGITKLSPEEEIEFQKFYATLPENLQTDDATYDIRGYWDSEGRPEKFNYDQPKESDGYYHAYSINSNTGEYLKSPAHETFQHAVDEDRKIGYRPITNVYGRNIATENSSLADSDAQSFLRNMIGAPSYIELELDDNQIEEYRKGGYIIEDISIPSLTKFVNGGEEDCPEGYMRSYNGQCVPSTMSEQVNDEEWYRNWYANRVIQDEEGQKLLNDARPKILKRAEAFPEITWYSDIGSSELGSFEPLTGEIKLNSAALDNNPFLKDEVKFHEKGHYLTSPNMKDPEADTVEEVAAHPIQQLRNYEANIVNQALKSRKNIPKRDRTYYDYLKGKGDSQPYTEEISKNLMQLRRLAGFKPDQVITEEDINNLYKKANEKGWTDPNSEFFVEPFINIMKYTKDNEQLKTLFNKIAKNEPEQVDQFQPQSARYGGALSKFIGGGYQVKDISVPSLTKAKNGRQTTGIDPAFQAKAQQVANNLGVSLEDLLGIMRHESGLNPGAVNPYTNATGLIQFMPNTARSLGTSIEALKNMSAIEQLDYVEKFYKPIAGKAKDIGDLYMFTFLPAAVGKPNNFVIGASGSSNKVFGINQNALYKQNKTFDADKKGYYTVGDVKNRISKFSGRPLAGSSDQSIPGFESSTTRTPGEKTVVKTTIIKDMQNDDWKPGKEEEQVDPRIEQLKTFTKIIEPSLQNINNIYAAAMQQKRFGGNTRMFQDGGMLIDASDEDINNYTNNGYIVEEVDEQDQLLNKPGYGAIGVSGSSPVPEYLQPSDVTWYGSPRQMVTAPQEVIYRSPVTGRLQSGQYDPNANQEQLADAATNIRYADVAQGRAESTTPTEEIKLSDRVIKSGNYLKGLKSVKPIKGLARPKGEFYTKEEYEKFDKDKLEKSGYYPVQLKDGNYEILKKEDISNMILARGITPQQLSTNYKIGDSKSITKDFKPVYDYAQQLQAQRVGPMIDELIYSGKSVDQAIKALVAKGEDTYEGIKQKYGEYAKTIKKDADKIYTERLEANKKKEQANQQGLEVNYEKKQRLEEDLLIQNYLNQDTKGLSESQRKTLLNLAISQKERTDRLNSEIDKAQRESAAGFGSGTRDATATQAYPSRNPYSEATATIQRLGQEKANAAYAANVAKYVITNPKLTEEDRRNILSDPDEFNEAVKAYNEFQNKELKKELKKQLEADEMLGRVYKPQYQSGIASMVYPEWLAIGPSGWLKEAGSGLLRGVNAINKIGLNDLLPATLTNNYLTSLGLSLAEREALASKLAPFTVGNILTAESAAKIGTEYIPNIVEGKNVGRNIAETVVSALPLYKPASSIGAINYGRSLFNADKYGIKAYQHPDDIKSDFKLLKAISTLTGHQDGGMVMDLSDKEIDEYRKGGWIVEEID